MRGLTLAILMAMNAYLVPSAEAAELLLSAAVERPAAFGDVCRPPPWYRGWSRIAPFVCNEYLGWPRYYYYGMGPRRQHH